MEYKERGIYLLKSGFRLLGLGEYELNDMSLVITDLGSIYVSKVDSLSEDFFANSIFSIKPDFLEISTESRGISVVGKSDDDVTILIVLSPEELIDINSRLKRNIFVPKDGNSIAIIDEKILAVVDLSIRGDFFRFEIKRFLSHGKAGFLYLKIPDKDVELLRLENNRMSMRGYMYSNEDYQSIIRKIDILIDGEISGYEKKREKISSLKEKIGILPKNDQVVMASIRGAFFDEKNNSYRSFLNEKAICIRHEDSFYFYSYEDKKEIFSYRIGDIYGINYVDSIFYIIGKNTSIGLSTAKNDMEYLMLKDIPEYRGDNIVITKDKNIIFSKIENGELIFLPFYNSALEITRISLGDISDISLVSVEGKFSKIELRFSDRRLELNVMNSFFEELDDIVYRIYAEEVYSNSNIHELYQNWVRSVADMVVFDFCGYIYFRSKDYDLKNAEELDLSVWVSFINAIYDDSMFILQEIDKMAVYLSDMLSSSEYEYFRTKKIDFDSSLFDALEKSFFEVRDFLKSDLKDLLSILDTLRFCITHPNNRSSVTAFLKESERYRIELFSKYAYDRFWHIIYTMLPHYVLKLYDRVFRVYSSIEDKYKSIDEEDLKEDLISRISSIRKFRNKFIEMGKNETKGDIVDDLYSLSKFARMRIDSEFYYTDTLR